MTPQLRSRLRRVALICALPLGLWLVLMLTLQSRWGRAKVGELIADTVSAAIAGQLRIDELLYVGFNTVHVRGLAFVDPRGRDVVSIDDAEVRFVWSALFSRTLRFDRARTRGVELLILTGQSSSTSLEDTFAAPPPPDGEPEEPTSDDDAIKVLLDHVDVADATVRILTGVSMAVHVSQATLRLDHDLSRHGAGERPTDVDLSGVYGNFYMDGREAISGTDVRAAGSIFDLRLRACHPRGIVALRLHIGGGPPRMVYSAERPLMNIVLRMVDLFTAMEMESGDVDMAEVPRCGPPPEP